MYRDSLDSDDISSSEEEEKESCGAVSSKVNVSARPTLQVEGGFKWEAGQEEGSDDGVSDSEEEEEEANSNCEVMSISFIP